ncbi:hypothetical protein VP01_73g1 [Puccinia sorghi]|uniref:Uncharacterized protein n=1 Tax=Puccinia sorghi TaxID=27349 RepID=A0A0L6UCK7_9BASI|nr:hypothetical protein VP01_73g1 [Puccinia sorghi]
MKTLIKLKIRFYINQVKHIFTGVSSSCRSKSTQLILEGPLAKSPTLRQQVAASNSCISSQYNFLTVIVTVIYNKQHNHCVAGFSFSHLFPLKLFTISSHLSKSGLIISSRLREENFPCKRCGESFGIVLWLVNINIFNVFIFFIYSLSLRNHRILFQTCAFHLILRRLCGLCTTNTYFILYITYLEELKQTQPWFVHISNLVTEEAEKVRNSHSLTDEWHFIPIDSIQEKGSLIFFVNQVRNYNIESCMVCIYLTAFSDICCKYGGLPSSLQSSDPLFFIPITSSEMIIGIKMATPLILNTLFSLIRFCVLLSSISIIFQLCRTCPQYHLFIFLFHIILVPFFRASSKKVTVETLP